MCTPILTCCHLSIFFCLLGVPDTDLLAEHKHQKARAVAANQQAAMVTASKETTVNDLTRGIVNYKWLGLDFEKADNERLRCVATSLCL
jgi:hypothetical protein